MVNLNQLWSQTAWIQITPHHCETFSNLTPKPPFSYMQNRGKPRTSSLRWLWKLEFKPYKMLIIVFRVLKAVFLLLLWSFLHTGSKRISQKSCQLELHKTHLFSWHLRVLQHLMKPGYRERSEFRERGAAHILTLRNNLEITSERKSPWKLDFPKSCEFSYTWRLNNWWIEVLLVGFQWIETSLYNWPFYQLVPIGKFYCTFVPVKNELII